MNYLRLPHMDNEVSVFDICQAHLQLEADYNNGGWVRERPSNRRRMESTGVQLLRMGFSPGMRWVEIVPAPGSAPDDSGDDAVRDIYLMNVLKWGLPIDAEMMAFIKERYVPDFLAQFPQCAGDDYLQGR